MEISGSTKVSELIDKHPFMLEFFAQLSPKFQMLQNPIMRKTIGSVATLSQAATLGGIPLDRLLSEIAGEITQDRENRCGPIRLDGN